MLPHRMQRTKSKHSDCGDWILSIKVATSSNSIIEFNMSEKSEKDVEMGPLIAKKADVANEDHTAQIESRPEPEKVVHNSRKALNSCFLYCLCSVAMVLANKSLASSYNHLIDGSLNILLVVFQAVIAVACVEFCKKMKWVDYPNFDVKTAVQWSPVNILFCGMLFSGMASLQHNSVPMVTVVKNICNIVVTIGDYYFFSSKVGGLVMVSFGIMLGGAVAAAWNDLYATRLGIFWMVANILTTAGYILYMKFATKHVKLSKFGMVYYNNVLCTIFLLPVSVINGEMSLFWKTESIHTLDYLTTNSFAGFVGFFLNFASLNCVANAGPTTYVTVGSLNKIPITFLGYFMFDDKITSQTWFFIWVSLMGGFLYTYAQIIGDKKKEKDSK